MRILMNAALVLSLLAVPAAASACGMEIDFDRKHTLVAKAADAPSADKASVLKALLAEVDAKMEAELVVVPTAPAETAPALVVTAPSVEAEPATYPSGFPTAKVAKR